MKYQNHLPALFASRRNRRDFVSTSLATLAGAAAAVVPPPPVSQRAFAQAGGQGGNQTADLAPLRLVLDRCAGRLRRAPKGPITGPFETKADAIEHAIRSGAGRLH
jgi:hypothetical protein